MRKQLIADSSILIALSKKGELEGRLTRWKNEGYEVIIPKAIAEEVIEEPTRFAQDIRERSSVLADTIMASATMIKTKVAQGLIKVETVNYKKHSKIMDNVRKHLSKLDAKPEHAIKKGDPEFIALVIQLYEEAKEKVFVATLDKELLKALKPFSNEVEYEVLEEL
jgi:rRNA-processing protein FCF1